MKNFILAAALVVGASIGGLAPTAYAAGVVPCEDMLRDVRAAMATAKLNDAEMQQVKDLEAKGVERCNADDDKRADAFFADALKLMGKA